MNVGVGFVQVANSPLHILLVAIAPVDQHSKLSQGFLPSSAYIKTSPDELFDNGRGFDEQLRVDVYNPLKFADIEIDNGFFETRCLCPLLRLLCASDPPKSKHQGERNGLCHCRC